MSTKTSFKRIAAVAAVALTLGGFSAVSANAAVSVTSYATDYAATSVALGQDAVLVLHQDFLASAVNDTQTLTVAVTGNVYGSTSATTNSTWPTVFKGTDTATVSTGTDAEKARGYAAAAVYGGFPAADITAGSTNLNNTQVVTNNSSTSITVANSAIAVGRVRGFERIEWKPTVAGTYSLKITSNSPGDSLWSYTWTFTVGSLTIAQAAAAASATAALAQTPSALWSIIRGGYNSCTFGNAAVTICDTYGSGYTRVAGTGAVPVQIPTTATSQTVYYPAALGSGVSGQNAALHYVTINGNTSTAAVPAPMPGATVYASVSGPGVVTLSDPATYSSTTSSNTSYATGRSVRLVSTTGVAQINVFSDGTPGAGVVTISAANSSTATPVVLGSYTVNFYTTPSTATATRVVTSVAGDTGAATTGVATITVKDATGNVIPAAQLQDMGYTQTLYTDNTTVMTDKQSVPAGSVTVTPKGGYYGKANLTVKVSNDAGAGLATAGLDLTNPASTVVNTISTNTWPVSVAKNQIATLTMAADSGTYSPGAKAVLTFTASDVNGLPVPDALVGTVKTTSTIATSVATQNGSALADFASMTSLSGWIDGVITLGLYVPIAEGDFTLSLLQGGTTTTGAAAGYFSAALAGTSLTKTLTVGASAATAAAQAAQDAANEAIDAANAATDAANNAMDSADAATAAAQDAGDKADAALAAITDLATKVSDIASQVSSLSALVKKIAAAVAKISAKVKA